MMDKKVSVIIPVYNAKEYAVCAIRSVLAQTLQDIEIIAVDDASTDGSYALLLETFSSNEKVRLFRQPENKGVGAARNRGLTEASGEYIAFLDSDDAMRPDMLEKMYETAKQYDAQVLHTTGCLLPAVSPLPADLAALPEESYKPLILERCEQGTAVYHAPKEQSARIDEWCTHKYHWAIWNKLYQRSFLEEHQIRFDDLSMAEDMLFCFKCIYFADCYTVLPGQWYIYRTEGSTLSRKEYTPERICQLTEKQIAVSKALACFLNEAGAFVNDPARKIKVERIVCDSLDRFYIVPALEKLGLGPVMEDGVISRLFKEEFGDRGGFVEYLYWRLHELMNTGFDYTNMMKKPEDLVKKADEARTQS